jgi:hypothetical protein
MTLVVLGAVLRIVLPLDARQRAQTPSITAHGCIALIDVFEDRDRRFYFPLSKEVSLPRIDHPRLHTRRDVRTRPGFSARPVKSSASRSRMNREMGVHNVADHFLVDCGYRVGSIPIRIYSAISNYRP